MSAVCRRLTVCGLRPGETYVEIVPLKNSRNSWCRREDTVVGLDSRRGYDVPGEQSWWGEPRPSWGDTGGSVG